MRKRRVYGGMNYSKLLAFMAVVVLLFAAECTQQENGPPQGHSQEQTPSTAKILCLPHNKGDSAPKNDIEVLNGSVLTRILTPKVAAQSDGVHYRIDNRLGQEIPYSTSDIGSSAPEGVRNHVLDYPPGKFGIACEPPAKDYDPGKTKMAYFQIVVGDSGYKSTELECRKGAKPIGTYMSVTLAAGANPEKFDPKERVREQYSRRLKEGDVVEEAGYPGAQGPKPVRVVRGGKVVAVIHYDRWGGYEESYCQGQF